MTETAPIALVGTQARRPRSNWRPLRRGAIYGVLGVGAVLTLFPFAWMVSTSLKSDLAVFQTPPQLIPHPFRPSNYSSVVDVFPIWRFMFNSVVVALVSVVAQVFTGATAGYAFARMKFRGSGLLFLLYLATLMVPFQVTIVPLFVEMRELGLVNTYPGLILPTIASAFGTFLMRQSFMTLPRELEEAAFVDGAGQWRVFWQIVLPLSKPALATFAIFAFIASWNSFLWPLVIVSSTELMTLPVGLSNLQGERVTAWNLVMAGTTISVVPIVAVYLIAQKHIVRGIATTGLKG